MVDQKGLPGGFNEILQGQFHRLTSIHLKLFHNIKERELFLTYFKFPRRSHAKIRQTFYNRKQL